MAIPTRESVKFYSTVSRFQVETAARFIGEQIGLPEETARAIFGVGTASIAGGELIVNLAVTIGECIGTESGKWHILNDLRAQLNSDESEKLSFKHQDAAPRRLSPSQIKMILGEVGNLFGKAPELAKEKPAHPGPRPADGSKNFPAWQKAFRAVKRWEFIREWNRGFSDIVIGDGCHRVRAALKLIEVFQTPKERTAFNALLDEAYNTDQAAKAVKEAPPAASKVA
ncbi:hypothetical protein HYV70_00595 [Candidatus Uhrbacteria bacterium]|nr:hypothetical protein [Candidatus Uhrbacteria bacterium]